MSGTSSTVTAPIRRPARLTRPGRSGLLALAATALVVALWSRSWPGVPVVGVLTTIALLIGGLAYAAATARRIDSAQPLVLAAVGLALVAVAGLTPGAGPLQLRWAASSAAFTAEVDRVPAPTSASPDDTDATFGAYPASCPTRLGAFPLEDCVAIDGGYLYLQAWGALTDVSGVAYLPTGPEGHAGFAPQEWRPLGGPWYAWTCHC